MAAATRRLKNDQMSKSALQSLQLARIAGMERQAFVAKSYHGGFVFSQRDEQIITTHSPS